MPRTARIVFPGAVYHVMNRGNNRQLIFRDDKDYYKYLKLLEKHCEQLGVIVYCYSLMSTHLHLLLETPKGNLPSFMRGLNISYMCYYKKKYKLIGHLFQGRNKSIVVDKDSYLLELTRYIHLNPVRAGIVNHPEDYKWSSYLSYLEGGDTFIDANTVLNYLGEINQRQKYSKFVEDMLNDKTKPFIYEGVIHGDENFADMIFKTVEKRKQNDTDRLRRKGDRQMYNIIKFDDILQRLAKFYNLSHENLLFSKIKHFKMIRHQLIYLVRLYTNLGLAEIGEKIGPCHHSTVAKIIKHIESNMETDSEFRQKILELRDYIVNEK